MNHVDQKKLSARSVIALRTAGARIIDFKGYTSTSRGRLYEAVRRNFQEAQQDIFSTGTDGAKSRVNRVLVKRVSKAPERLCLPRHIRRRCQRERADDGQAGRIVKLVKQSRKEWVDYAAC